MDQVLHATPLSPYAVQLSWPMTPAASAVQVYMNGRLVDQFPATGDSWYQIHELWPGTSYRFGVSLSASTGATIASYIAGASTPPDNGSFPRLYAPDAFVNTSIPSGAPLDPDSPAMVSSALVPYASSANLSNDPQWGIPIVSSASQSRTYDVGCEYYWCNVGLAPLHIPADAQPSTGGDGHLVVLQPDGSELDLWAAQRTPSGWTAGERWVESANGPASNCSAGSTCGGADAANFALAAGIVRPQEIAQGHIDHALLITTPYTRQGYAACPATGTDGQQASPTALPIGAHMRLDPAVDVAALPIPQWQKVIAIALQQYGAYVGDTGGSLEVRAQSNVGLGYDAWAKAGVTSNSPSLADLPWSRMQVLAMSQCGS